MDEIKRGIRELIRNIMRNHGIKHISKHNSIYSIAYGITSPFTQAEYLGPLEFIYAEGDAHLRVRIMYDMNVIAKVISCAKNKEPIPTDAESQRSFELIKTCPKSTEFRTFEDCDLEYDGQRVKLGYVAFNLEIADPTLDKQLTQIMRFVPVEQREPAQHRELKKYAVKNCEKTYIPLYFNKHYKPLTTKKEKNSSVFTKFAVWVARWFVKRDVTKLSTFKRLFSGRIMPKPHWGYHVRQQNITAEQLDPTFCWLEAIKRFYKSDDKTLEDLKQTMCDIMNSGHSEETITDTTKRIMDQ